jgi:hypothetical protein
MSNIIRFPGPPPRRPAGLTARQVNAVRIQAQRLVGEWTVVGTQGAEGRTAGLATPCWGAGAEAFQVKAGPGMTMALIDYRQTALFGGWAAPTEWGCFADARTLIDHVGALVGLRASQGGPALRRGAAKSRRT